MKAFALFLLTATTCLGLAGWQNSAKTKGFSDLPRGDTLKIHYHSSGCFHQDDYDFIYQRAASSTVDVINDPSTKSARSFPRLTLTDEDVKSLDRLLHFYRTVKKGDCTTQDTVTFSQIHNGKAIATETHVDGTCQLEDTPGVLSLRDVFQRASANQASAP